MGATDFSLFGPQSSWTESISRER